MKRPSAHWPQLAEKKLEGKIRSCPNCESEDLTFKSIVEAPIAQEPKAYVGDGKPRAFFLRVQCSDCAFVRLFDAESLGLMVNV